MAAADESLVTERLLSAAAQGNLSAVGELVDMHRDYLRRVIELQLDQALRGRVDASDIIQETHVVVTKRINDYIARRPTSFKLWLRGEAIQQIGAQRRRHVIAARRSVLRECEMSDASSLMIARSILQSSPSKKLETRETVAKIRQIIEGLPPTDREMILLRYVEALSNSEAAELLQIDPAAARKRHGRALRKLFELMVKHGLSQSEFESPN